MKPEQEWTRGLKKDEIVDQMRVELEKRPGVVYNFSQPIKDRVEESISGIRGQIVLKVYGRELVRYRELLRDLSRRHWN